MALIGRFWGVLSRLLSLSSVLSKSENRGLFRVLGRFGAGLWAEVGVRYQIGGREWLSGV
jgi:hypothetical protein